MKIIIEMQDHNKELSKLDLINEEDEIHDLIHQVWLRSLEEESHISYANNHLPIKVRFEE